MTDECANRQLNETGSNPRKMQTRKWREREGGGGSEGGRGEREVVRERGRGEVRGGREREVVRERGRGGVRGGGGRGKWREREGGGE